MSEPATVRVWRGGLHGWVWEPGRWEPRQTAPGWPAKKLGRDYAQDIEDRTWAKALDARTA